MRLKFYYLILASFTIAFKSQAQNVGIGESAPVQKLHIDGSAAALQTIRIEDLGSNQDGDFGQTSGVNIQTNTSAKRVVYADGNGDLTSRFVYGDNIQTVIGTGASQTINTAVYTDINGLFITFTPRHSVVYVNFVVTGYVNLPLTGHASEWFAVRIERNGSNAGYTSLALVSERDGLSSTSAGSVSASMFPVTVTPGVPVTINLSGRNGGAVDLGFTIDKTNYTSYMTIWD